MKIKNIVIYFMIIFLLIQYLTPICSATEEQQSNDTNINLNEQNNQNLQIYSEAAILIEERTGKILYEKDIHARKYPASTTKILTAILAIENCDLNETATASYQAVNSVEKGYTKADIQVGETFTIEQLLSVLILQSANEAANIIAEHISGSVSEFAKLMNQKAKEIGCVDSNFVNANGAHNENHYSSAYDLAMIARYSMNNETFRRIVSLKECSLPHTEFWTDEKVEEHGERNFKNTNNLLMPDSKYYYPYAMSIKAGFTTPAKNCLVTASNKNGFETIAVVLHAENTEDGSSARYIDTINLFEYGYNNYNLKEIYSEYNLDIEDINNGALGVTTENNTENINNENINLMNNGNSNVNTEKIDKEIIKEIIKIVSGISILLLIVIYYIIKKIKKNKIINSNLYYFKID